MAVLSPQQCRAARAWLDIRQDELARRASVGLSTLRDFEAEKRSPIPNNVQAIRRALEQGGIEFLEQGGRRGVIGPDNASADEPARTAAGGQSET